MEENQTNLTTAETTITDSTTNTVLKDIVKVAKKINTNNDKTLEEMITEENTTKFKLCTNTLPEKTGVWTKIKNLLLTEITIELTPHQQKIKNEINEFLHQDVTWKKIRDLLFTEITFGKKKNIKNS